MIRLFEPFDEVESGRPTEGFGRRCDAVVRFLVLAVLFLVPLAFIPWHRWDLYVPVKTFLIQILLLAAVGVVVVKAIVTGRAQVVRSGLNLPVLLFLLAAVLSLADAFNPAISLRALSRLVFLVLTFFLILNYFHDSRQIHRLLLTVLASFAGVILYAVLQQMGIDLVGAYKGRSAVDSTLGNPDFFAGYLLGVIPLLLVLVLTAKNKSRVLVIVAALAGAAFLFLTRSRAGFLGFVLCFLIVLFFIFMSKNVDKSMKKRWVQLTLIGVVLVMALTWTSGSALSRISETLNLKSGSIRSRLLFYQATVDIVGDHPITGTGLGSFYHVYPKYRVPEMKQVYTYVETPKQTHNDYLQIASEMGLVGLAALVYLLFAFFRTGWSTLRKDAPGPRRWLTLGLIAGCAGILVQILFDFNLHRPANALYFWCILGLMGALATGLREKKYLQFALPRWVRGAAALGLLAAVPILMWVIVTPFVGHLYYNRALALTAEEEYQLAIDPFEQAVRYDPLDDIYYRYFGDCYDDLAQLPDIDSTRRREYLEKASACYRSAIELCPYYSMYQFKLGYVYRLYGNEFDSAYLGKAEARFRKAIALSPHTEAQLPHNQLGILYQDQQRFDLAIREFKAAVAVKPRSTPPHINLGNIYYSRGDYDQAIESFSRALQVNPNDPMVQCNLAYAYLRKNMFREATLHFDKALRINRHYIEAYNGMADIAMRMGNPVAARKLYSKVIQIGPDTPAADYARSQLKKIRTSE